MKERLIKGMANRRRRMQQEHNKGNDSLYYIYLLVSRRLLFFGSGVLTINPLQMNSLPLNAIATVLQPAMGTLELASTEHNQGRISGNS